MPGKPAASEKPATRLRRRAMDLLARREHTFEELLQKLISRFPEDDESLIREVLIQLQQDNLLSDERFMESYLHNRQRAGMGPLKISMELRQKGVAGNDAESAIASIPDEEWQELAKDVVIRKFPEAPVTAQQKQKAWRFLIQRGFDSDCITRVMKSAWSQVLKQY